MAALGAIMPAVEPRIKANVLYVAGLKFQHALPEVDHINYITRVRQPTLMLNGELDFFFPAETSQRPMFELLGTPPRTRTARLSREATPCRDGDDQGVARVAGSLSRAGGVIDLRSDTVTRPFSEMRAAMARRRSAVISVARIVSVFRTRADQGCRRIARLLIVTPDAVGSPATSERSRSSDRRARLCPCWSHVRVAP